VHQNNIFRKELPFLFNPDGTEEGRRKIIQEKLASLAKVPLPAHIKQHYDVSARLKLPVIQSLRKRSPFRENVDPMKDTGYIRRLKMANYGKWYLQPADFKTKIKRINQELDKYELK
jgi:hypothetical protein